jgi:hypothetical protein
MNEQLQKVINLIKKTGDRLIVFDRAKPDETFVIMGLKDYENIAIGRSDVRGLTEDELLDRINRDIAIWKSEQENTENYSINTVNFSQKLDHSTVDNYSELEPIKRKKQSGWAIPENRKQFAEEVINEVEEEDRQYLEEILV